MGISIAPKTDYSALFSGLSASSGANLNFLSDYRSIKNGSYGKLMKAYYAKDGASTQVSSLVSKSKPATTTSTAKDSVETLSKIERSAEKLKATSDSLSSDEAFVSGDKDKILEALKGFVGDYNDLIKNVNDSDTSSIIKKTQSLADTTFANEGLLNKLGITIGEDATLSINRDVFDKADMSTAKSLFTGPGSYAYSVSSQSMLIDYQANYEAIKANTYTSEGTFGKANVTGSMFDSLF